MENSEVTKMIVKCGHCHTKGRMKILGEVIYEPTEWMVDPNTGQEVPFLVYATDSWMICQCENCENYNILFMSIINDGHYYPYEPSIIYPESITYKASDAIDLIFRAGIESLKVSPGGAVNQFRVILEMIWSEHMPEGTAKPRLRGNSGIIKQLVDNRVLAGDYAEMADVLANIGNQGSHYDETSVTQEDAEMARELCTVILEHVYQTRPKGLELVEKLEQRFPRENGWRDGEYLDKTEYLQ